MPTPSAVQPKEVNDVRLIEIGIIAWIIAFAYVILFVGPGKAMGVTFFGICLGFYGRRYTKRRRQNLIFSNPEN